MRRGSGPCTGSPSMRTSPAVGVMKPAITFRMVDLPQPDGPSRHTNSPSPTERLMSSSTLMLPPSRWNTMSMPLAQSLAFRAGALSGIVRPRLVIGIAPTDRWDSLERADADIEQEPDNANHHHPRNHEVVSVPGVARVHDHESEPRVHRDHLRGHDHHPRDAERDPKADDQLRHHRGIQHVVEERSTPQSEIAADVHVDLGNDGDGVHGRDRDW